MESLTDERDQAQAEITDFTLNRPVQEMLERTALDPDLFRLKFAQEFTFALEDGEVVIHDTEGNVPTVKDDKGKEREATFTREDINRLCDASPHAASYARILAGSKASGGGAGGVKSGRAPVQADKPAPAPAPPRFGLQ